MAGQQRPLDGSAAQCDIGPMSQVQKLIERVGARGHATFGGRLSPDATGFPARAMAKTRPVTGAIEQRCAGGWLRSSSNSQSHSPAEVGTQRLADDARGLGCKTRQSS